MRSFEVVARLGDVFQGRCAGRIQGGPVLMGVAIVPREPSRPIDESNDERNTSQMTRSVPANSRRPNAGQSLVLLSFILVLSFDVLIVIVNWKEMIHDLSLAVRVLALVIVPLFAMALGVASARRSKRQDLPA
jgi:hypothetical protein